MKACTDISQSKTLSKILSLESADMCYKCLGEDPYDLIVRPYSDWKEEYKGLLISGDANVIPAWSLASLLGVLPKIVNNETLFIGTSAALWHVGYRNIYFARTDNLIDACCELILKLNELNLL